MYEIRLVYFYELQDVIQEGWQRNLWTEQAQHLPHQRKQQLPWSAGSRFLYDAKGNLYEPATNDMISSNNWLYYSCLMLNHAYAIENSSYIFGLAIESYSPMVFRVLI